MRGARASVILSGKSYRMKFCTQRSLLAAAALVLLFGAAQPRAQEASGGPATGALAELAARTEELKASTSELIRAEEEKVATASAKLEQLRQLFSEGIVAKAEVDRAEGVMLESNSRLEGYRRQLAEAERVYAEAEAADKRFREQAAKAAALAAKNRAAVRYYNAGAPMVRYTGKTGAGVQNLSGVQAFFSATFGRPLPLSAVGQSATHDRFGYDHRDAVDVPLHPDSVEGRALIGYLQSRGIAFLAFRTAVPGVATGPHIHIGRPSGRIG